MTFSDDIKKWTEKVNTRSRDVFVGTVMAAHESIVIGSPITGSPGQPVDAGILRGSWTVDIEGDVATIATKVAWAPSNEDGVARPGGGSYQQRSPTGGRWSVALTRAGFPLLVADVTRKLGP